MQQANFTVKTMEEKGNSATFVIEPLEKGYGDTLGTALRRVLLGSFKGAAITSVKVAGVTHKFSTLEGMSEDMIDLMLNLKGVRVAYEGDEPVKAKLSVKGPKVVTADMIVTPTSVKVVNGDAVIANLGKGASLDMELTVATGYGYSPAEERPSETIGTVSLDAIFSPVERVAYHVESTRVGRRTDYDKLVLEIYTDGSQVPADILKAAARILVESFQQIVEPKTVDEAASVPASASAAAPVEDLGLPTRVGNALKSAGYKTVADLSTASDKDLKNVKNLGGKSIDMLDEALATKGITRTK